MSLLDRYILRRFIANFIMLLTLLFIFAVAIDLILNLDKFVDAARALAGPDSSGTAVAVKLAGIIANFEGPRIFQFYAYLHGMVAIGAMGFTLAQMHRYRELVAMMASGVSLYRVAMPFIVAVFCFSMLQLLNQELVLPRIAPLLLRSHGDIGAGSIESFEVRFTPDSRGNLLQAASFNPHGESGARQNPKSKISATADLPAARQNPKSPPERDTLPTLEWPTFLILDESGRTVSQITARRARWSEAERAWLLQNGEQVSLRDTGTSGGAAEADLHPQPIDRYVTDLSPEVLLVGRYNQFAAMLSMDQINQMLETPRFTDRASLLRYKYSRFSSVLVNLLVLVLTLPCFLLREPANLLRQSVLAAALAIPASMGAAIGMMVDLPGIPPALGVFLPVIVLMFMSLFPWTFFKT